MLIKIVGENFNTVNYIVYEPSELEYKYENGEQKVIQKKGKIKSQNFNTKFDEEKVDSEVVIKAGEKIKVIETPTLDGDAVVLLPITVKEKEMKNNGKTVMVVYELVPSEEIFKKIKQMEAEKEGRSDNRREKEEQKQSIVMRR